MEMVEYIIPSFCRNVFRTRRKTEKTASQKPQPKNLNITFIGDPKVGKSSLISAYIFNKYPLANSSQKLTDAKMTLKVNGKIYRISLDEKSYRFQVTKRNFDEIKENCFVLCYSDKESFGKLYKWLKHLSFNYLSVPVVIVETKSDLADNFSSNSCAEKLIEEIQIAHKSIIRRWVKVSAKTREGLELLFVEAILAAKIHRKRQRLSFIEL